MQSKELGKSDPWSERNFVLVLDDGEEAFGAITKFCEEQGITGASFTAIGAFKRAKLGFFDFTQKRYNDIPVDTQSAVLSAIGDVASTATAPWSSRQARIQCVGADGVSCCMAQRGSSGHSNGCRALLKCG